MDKRIHRNTRIKTGRPGLPVRTRRSPVEPERENKARVFLSGLILAGLLAGASMLPDNKESEGRASSDEVGSPGAGAVQVAKVDFGGERHTATDANDSAGTQDRR
jgi:hypothetical protein